MASKGTELGFSWDFTDSKKKPMLFPLLHVLSVCGQGPCGSENPHL